MQGLTSGFIVFHVLRWVSRIGTWLPRRLQKFETVRHASGGNRASPRLGR
ncbi:hypothetical protein [Variovorax paradoxus]|jgi:cardiolipin synthase